jgi:DNA-binding transcriptional regulator PaaX
VDENHRLDAKYKSSLHYILSGLIPYTEANIKLSFKPNAFFNDLEKLDKINANKKTIKTAYYRAIKNGYIEIDNRNKPSLSKKGITKLALFEPKILKDSKIMVIFDIPENYRGKRSQLRLVLRELKFVQVQKSVWITRYEIREYLQSEIERLKLKKFIKIFEAIEV